MLDLERILRKIIAYRFKKLRGDIPYELISSQRANMNRIEQGINVTSGNFVSDTLLDEYSKYFGKSKPELIFGNDAEIENTLYFMFLQVFVKIIPDVKVPDMQYPDVKSSF